MARSRSGAASVGHDRVLACRWPKMALGTGMILMELEAIKANLFPASHAAICDWDHFPWHRHRGVIQTHKLHSSQALAIDVFGTIKVSAERDRIFSALARKCDVPEEGPWTLTIEWTDPDDLLHEPTPTQVDAIAFGAHAVLVVECKFTEPGGHCSQVVPIGKGRHRGVRQCNGDYALQTNPVKGKTARCALTAKRILYWKTIPSVFGFDSFLLPFGAPGDRPPCSRQRPFAPSVRRDAH
jgi:hypothetical protein